MTGRWTALHQPLSTDFDKSASNARLMVSLCSEGPGAHLELAGEVLYAPAHAVVLLHLLPGSALEAVWPGPSTQLRQALLPLLQSFQRLWGRPLSVKLRKTPLQHVLHLQAY